LGILLLGIVVVITGEEMAKAGLVNGFAGQSKNIQRTVIEVVNTPKPTTLNPI
jgi:hypothetical protein